MPEIQVDQIGPKVGLGEARVERCLRARFVYFPLSGGMLKKNHMSA